jgi:Methyltransferase domain
MTQTIRTVLAEVTRIAPSLHRAGTFSARALEAIVRHASSAPVRHSVETGSGASTLLLSHLSEHHTVFAVDAGTGSIRSIETSPLLRRDVVTFVEGPTQLTLPVHRFSNTLQLVLIDGPHGYPFPDLEYFYLYPQLDPDALLIVDDIHIPTITNLYDFLCADEMFALQETVETTAFFRRTEAPTFSTIEDGWWMQAYNRAAYDGMPPELVTADDSGESRAEILFHLDRFGEFSNPLQHQGVMRVDCQQSFVVAGWAVNTTQRRPATALEVVLDGKRYRAAVRGFRADVANAYDEQAYLRSGFAARFPPGCLTRGSHDVEIRVMTGDDAHHHPVARFSFEAF